MSKGKEALARDWKTTFGQIAAVREIFQRWREDVWVSEHGDRTDGIVRSTAVMDILPVCRAFGISAAPITRFSRSPSDEELENAEAVLDELLLVVDLESRHDALGDVEPLTDREKEVLAMIPLVAHGGITGKEIVDKTDIDQATLTRHIIPKLKAHGVKNRRGVGYFRT